MDSQPLSPRKPESEPVPHRRYAFPFRKDIQGMRGLAVLLVVLYHAGLPIHGGFIGVDVFFVISGFVITGGILATMEKGQFSYAEFYGRRVRRLLPALATMLVAVLIIGTVLGPWKTQALTAKTAVAASLINANHFLFDSVGYFQPAAELNPLLHTWSLSVEEQFYLVFPAIVVWAYRWRNHRGNNAVGVVIALLSVLAFISCVFLTYHPSGRGPRLAFYAALPRAWEFGVGALIAVALPTLGKLGRRIDLVGPLGLLVVLASALLIDVHTPFPGIAAVPPTLGTALMIIGGIHETRFKALLSSALPVYAGELSYSWYLWHWPMIVFGAATAPSPFVGAVFGAIASLGVAWLSYRWVEQPIRHRSRERRWPAPAVFAICVVMPIIASSAQPTARRALHVDPVLRDQVESRSAYAAIGCDSNHTFNAPKSSCRWPGESGKTVLLLGDSTARQHIPALRQAASERRATLIATTKSACPFVQVEHRRSGKSRKSCTDWVSKNLELLEQDPPDVVVLAGAWDWYAVGDDYTFYENGEPVPADDRAALLSEALADVVAKIQRNGSRVVLIEPTPKFMLTADDLFSRHLAKALKSGGGSCSATSLAWLDTCTTSRPLDDERWLSMDMVRGITRKANGLANSVVDLTPVLCPDGTCRMLRQDRWVYVDGGHVTPFGALLGASTIRDSIDSALASGPQPPPGG